jgi:hypothetical protein
VGIHDQGIGKIDAILRPALLLADPRGARVRRVDVEPGAGRMRPFGELAHRVDGGKRGRAHGRHDARGVVQVVAVDRHPQLVVDRHLAQLHPEHARVLLH